MFSICKVLGNKRMDENRNSQLSAVFQNESWPHSTLIGQSDHDKSEMLPARNMITTQWSTTCETFRYKFNDFTTWQSVISCVRRLTNKGSHIAYLYCYYSAVTVRCMLYADCNVLQTQCTEVDGNDYDTDKPFERLLWVTKCSTYRFPRISTLVLEMTRMTDLAALISHRILSADVKGRTQWQRNVYQARVVC